jgi:hypothetical protein
MANQSDRIHDAIYTAINTFAFPHVTFDKDTGLRTTGITTETPETLLVREVSSGFIDAQTNRRTPRLRERQDWRWEADVVFDNQVGMEEFEALMATTAIFLPRTGELDQQATVHLEETEVEHPAEQQSSTGSRVSFRFVAQLSRR